MAGTYCKFCGNRCFVDRIMPEDSRWKPGKSVHLATCVKGAEFDRQETGHDHTTAINPFDRDGCDCFSDLATIPDSERCERCERCRETLQLGAN